MSSHGWRRRRSSERWSAGCSASIPERVLFTGIAAILAWNRLDLLARPVRARPRAQPRVWPAAGLGAAIGFVGGAIGVILGTLRMPALLGVVGMDARRAVGTNLVVGFFLGVAVSSRTRRSWRSRWDLLAAGLLGAIPGAWLGAHKTGSLSEDAAAAARRRAARDRRRVRDRGYRRMSLRISLATSAGGVERGTATAAPARTACARRRGSFVRATILSDGNTVRRSRTSCSP